MKYVFLVSKQNLELSKAEVLNLLEVKNYEAKDNLLIITKKINHDLARRLAYTRRIYLLLFESDYKNLKTKIENYDWKKIYKKDFCVRKLQLCDKETLPENKIADLIWNRIKNPKANLENPTTSIEFILTKNRIYCGLLIYENKEKFEERRAHLRPELHPTSLSPRLARACINLTGIRKGTVVDPFCGSGGILIEAGLMHLKPIGYDIDQIMLNRAKINLNHYKIKNCKLIKGDATEISKKIDYVITDLPYGRNTFVKDFDDLYLRFLKNLKKILRKKAVVIFPDFINHKRLIKKAGLKIKAEFDYYLHKSLSKKIIVMG